MRNKKNIIMVVMLVSIALMSMGYALFATQLDINSTGNITGSWNIYFESISSGTKVGNASNAITPNVTGTSANMSANLSMPGDSMTYEVVLKNGGTVGAIIEDIKADAIGSSAIIYTISGLNIGDKLAGGDSKTITIKIEYDPTITSQPTETSKTLTVTINAVQDIGQTITNQVPSIEYPNALVTKIMNANTEQSDANVSFNSSSDSSGDMGLYYTSTNTLDNKTTYYFRGNVENNYVKFGTYTTNTCKYNGEDVMFMDSSYSIAKPNDGHECRDSDYICLNSTYGHVVGWSNMTESYCTGTLKGTWVEETPTWTLNATENILWRIVRINEDGSVRLITDQSVGQSAFNVNNGDNTYVGYMTGQVGATSYADAHSNTNNSTIKTFVDSWYEANLVQYTSMMSTEAGFCNDRATTGLGYGNNSTSYAAAGRNSRAFIPIFNCSQTNDLFTYSSTKGNNKLDYPVGLLTMDEAIYGGNYINDKDGDYITGGYLASNDAWWTMTPHSYGSGIYYMKSGQDIYTLAYTSNMTSVLGVRPVINLKSTVEISSGNGTSANPYIIKTS